MYSADAGVPPAIRPNDKKHHEWWSNHHQPVPSLGYVWTLSLVDCFWEGGLTSCDELSKVSMLDFINLHVLVRIFRQLQTRCPWLETTVNSKRPSTFPWLQTICKTSSVWSWLQITVMGKWPSSVCPWLQTTVMGKWSSSVCPWLQTTVMGKWPSSVCPWLQTTVMGNCLQCVLGYIPLSWGNGLLQYVLGYRPLMGKLSSVCPW